MIKHIHIFGAPGSGCTTLGSELASRLGYLYLDKDNYVYSGGKLLKPLIRNTRLEKDIRSAAAWVLGGHICGWGDFLIRYFELVIFLYVPLHIRLARLKERERIIWQKRGRSLENNINYDKFIKWNEGYDLQGGLALHEKWLTKVACPVMRLEGAGSVEENLERIVEKYFKQVEND